MNCHLLIFSRINYSCREMKDEKPTTITSLRHTHAAARYFSYLLLSLLFAEF